MSVQSVIRANLLLDVVSTTAESVYLNNTTVFSSSGQVPEYEYLCLPQLIECPLDIFPTRVIANYGEAKVPASASIVVQATQEWESTEMSVGNRGDASGFRTSTFHILIKNVNYKRDYDQVNNIVQRLVMLLDVPTRQGLNPARVPDLRVMDSTNELDRRWTFFRLYFKRAFVNTESEVILEFRCEYKRVFV